MRTMQGRMVAEGGCLDGTVQETVWLTWGLSPRDPKAKRLRGGVSNRGDEEWLAS